MMSIINKYQISSLLTAVLLLTACEHTPPDHRDPVTLPLYVNGDADNGSLIYQDACGQCHQLNAGDQGYSKQAFLEPHFYFVWVFLPTDNNLGLKSVNKPDHQKKVVMSPSRSFL